MNIFVSGESDAKGLSVILPYIAVGPAAVAIRRPELWNAWNLAGPGQAGRGTARRGRSKAWNMARLGPAWQGWAWLGEAWNMARSGAARRGEAWRCMSKAWNLGWRNNQQTQNTHGTR